MHAQVPSLTASWQTLGAALYVLQEITMPPSTVLVATVFQLPYKGETQFPFWGHATGGLPVVVRCVHV